MTSAALKVRTETGQLVGFSTMATKEWGQWWRTRRALLHMILWLLVTNGLITLVGIGDGAGENLDPQRLLQALTQVFFQAGGLWALIGVIMSTQNAMLGERQMGTAEWVLSKPVTRTAFYASKLLVNYVSFILLAVIWPAVVFFVQTPIHTYLQPNLLEFASGIGFHCLQLFFYLCLTLAASTWFDSRGAVAGVGVGFMFAGFMVPNFWPELAAYMPWALPGITSSAALGEVPEGWWIPTAITLLLAIGLSAVGIWRFHREEF